MGLAIALAGLGIYALIWAAGGVAEQGTEQLAHLDDADDFDPLADQPFEVWSHDEFNRRAAAALTAWKDAA